MGEVPQDQQHSKDSNGLKPDESLAEVVSIDGGDARVDAALNDYFGLTTSGPSPEAKARLDAHMHGLLYGEEEAKERRAGFHIVEEQNELVNPPKQPPSDPSTPAQ